MNLTMYMCFLNCLKPFNFWNKNMRVGKKIKFILSDLTDKVSSELHSKRFFKSGVMRMCRIPSGLKLGENIHAALRHNGQEFEKLKMPLLTFLLAINSTAFLISSNLML